MTKPNSVSPYISLFQKIFSSSHLLSKKLRFITTANITSTLDKFNEFFGFRIDFFILNYIISITILTASKAPCFCHLYTNRLFIVRRSRGLNNSFLFRFEKFKFNFYVYIHILFAKKVFYIVICS